MRNLLKYALIAVAGILLSAVMPIVGVGLLVYAGYRIARGIANRVVPPAANRQESVPVRRVTRSEGERVVRALRNVNWNKVGLPLYMKLGKVDGNTAGFTVSGMENLITGVKGLFRDTSFSFPVSDTETALKLQEMIRSGGLEAEVKRSGNGYEVSSPDVAVAGELAKAAYPPREADVHRSVTVGRQYLVEGAASYEDAVERLRSGKGPGDVTLINRFAESQDSIDGRYLPARNEGRRLDASTVENGLGAGVFLVTELETRYSDGKLKVPSSLQYSEAQAYLDENFRSDAPGVEQEVTTDYSDGVAEGYAKEDTVAVDMTFVDNRGDKVQIVHPLDDESVNASGIRAFAMMDTADIRKMLDDGVVPSGTEVLLSRDMPEPVQGKFVVEVPFTDTTVRSSLAPVVRLGDEPMKVALAKGLDEETINHSLMMKGASASTADSPYFADVKDDVDVEAMPWVKVNGVSLGQFQQRMLDPLSSRNMPELTPERQQQWAKDAAEIKFVNIEVDKENRQLRITSVVGDSSVKTQTRNLNDDEMKSLLSRGKLSNTQMKDLLMQFNPGFFQTYANKDGKSLLEDPVGSFLRGQKPQYRESRAYAETVSMAKENHRKKSFTNHL